MCCFPHLVTMHFCCWRRRGKYTTTAVKPNFIQNPSGPERPHQTTTVPVPITALPKPPTDLVETSIPNQVTNDNKVVNATVATSNNVSEVTVNSSSNQNGSIAKSDSNPVQSNPETVPRPHSLTTDNQSNLHPEQTSKPKLESTSHVTSSNRSSEIREQINNNENSSDMMGKTRISIDVDLSDIQGEVPLSIRRSFLQNGPSRDEAKDLNNTSNDSFNKLENEKVNQITSDNTNTVTVKFQPEVKYINEDNNVNENIIVDNDVNKTVVDRRRGGIIENIIVDRKTEIPNHPKSAEDTLHLKNAFATNDFLANVLTGESLDKVISAMHERKVSAGEVIIEEGEPGNNMYVSMRGTYEVYIKKKLYSTFSDKRVFGELAILYNSKRMATIKAVTDGKVWILQRHIYQQIVVQSAIQEFEQTLSFLRNVPLVNQLNEESLSKIPNLLKKEFFKTDAVIVRQGEPGDKFYIIRAGCVTISKENEGKVSELGQGAFFGERALLTNDSRQATVVANAPGVECLTLTRPEFRKHFNDILIPDRKKRVSTEKSAVPEPKFTTLPTSEYSDVTLDDLDRIITLGVGGFGRVELVRHRKNPKLIFALKYLKKIDMLQQDQVQHVFNERDIQINCNCVFIVRMYNTFKDNKYLYFLMESCLGGDLWTYLQKQKSRMVSEIDARFYASCVLEAFSYLHDRNIIYRDLKPENLLIDSKGYIKLTDFGFAKSLNSATKTYTFAGTPEYVAPEIIYNRGHDKSIDYWAFGVLIFELLVGKTPFRTDDHTNMMTYNRILRGINSIPFPPHVTKSATHLIQKLCRPIPTDRLGNQKNGIQDIRTHKWFQGFDWDKLRNQNMKAPFVPKLGNNVDTKYFEKFGDDDDIPPDETSSFANF